LTRPGVRVTVTLVSETHDWIGKVALVTGASSGIGHAIAQMLATAGLHVMLCARRRERLETLAESLRARAPASRILVQECDVRDEAGIRRAVDAARRELGGIDVLVNSAGLGRRAPLVTGTTEDWKEMLEVNVLGLCVFTREAVADMRSRGDQGHVFHISSMSGHRVPGRGGMYSATKFAVRALTEALRQELRAAGSRIRVTSISPGFVETEFAEVFHGDPDAARETYGRYPCLQPADVASTVRHALLAPSHVQFHDILLRPTEQPD
jgi:17beta-estradiol 17-dehydrogenase / 3beta-hydroxysteroid 3-dehydrogenase